MSDRDEARSRKIAMAALGAMTVIWIGLGGASFANDRSRPDPDAVTFRGQSAVAGKQVFQAYSCMDCHTVVGNGAYFAPDLTFIYREAGPAWVEAFLGSAASWPTKAAVDMRIDMQQKSGELSVASVDDYYAKYPGALRRVTERGGQGTLMPNLPFSGDEIPALIAFLEYSSSMNTQGWPPEIRATPDAIRRARGTIEGRTAEPSRASAEAPSPLADPVARGKAKSVDMGCTACHSSDGARLVGPSWKGLYGSSPELADGRTVVADDAYLDESILDPNTQIVSGYPGSVMPQYRGRLSDEELRDIVAYIRSLK